MRWYYFNNAALVVLATAPVMIELLPIRLRRLAFFVLIRWLPKLFLRFTFPVPVTLTLLDNPLWAFCFGI